MSCVCAAPDADIVDDSNAVADVNAVADANVVDDVNAVADANVVDDGLNFGGSGQNNFGGPIYSLDDPSIIIYGPSRNPFDIPLVPLIPSYPFGPSGPFAPAEPLA